MTTQIKLEVGKEYKDIRGSKIKILYLGTCDKFLGISENDWTYWYNLNGKCGNNCNIVSEWYDQFSATSWAQLYKNGGFNLWSCEELAKFNAGLGDRIIKVEIREIVE